MQSIQAIINAAEAAGALRAGVTFADIGLVLVRFSRPLPGPFPHGLDEQLAHRHLDLVIDGLRAVRQGTAPPLSGPALTLEHSERHVGRRARPRAEVQGPMPKSTVRPTR